MVRIHIKQTISPQNDSLTITKGGHAKLLTGASQEDDILTYSTESIGTSTIDRINIRQTQTFQSPANG